MILVDIFVLPDHLRRGDGRLVELLERNMVVMHPFAIGEIARANPSDRPVVRGLMQRWGFGGLCMATRR